VVFISSAINRTLFVIDCTIRTHTAVKVFLLVACSQISLLFFRYDIGLGLFSAPAGDVNNYREIAIGLFEKNLKPAEFTHGPFYAALGIPFLALNNSLNPYPLIASALVTAAGTLFLYKIIRYSNLKPSLVLLAYLFVELTSPLTRFILEGANNVTSYSMLLVAITLLVFKHTSELDFVFFTLAICLSIGTRYVDAILLLPLLIPCLRYCLIEQSQKLRISIFFILATCSILILFWTHQVYLGSFLRTPYDSKVPNIARVYNSRSSESPRSQVLERDLTKIFQRFDQVVIDNSRYAAPEDRVDQFTIYQKMPYLILFPTGVYLLIKRRILAMRASLYIGLAALSWVSFYSTAWYFTAHDIFYGCQRYLMGWIMPLGMVSLYSLSAESARDYLISLLLPLTVLASRASIRVYDKFLRVSCVTRIDNSIHVSCQRMAEIASVSGPIPKSSGSVVLNEIMISSVDRRPFKRLSLQVNSSHDSYFPKKIITTTTYDGINDQLILPKLSRENHAWEFKLDRPVSNIAIKILVPDPSVQFRVRRVDTFSW